MGWPRQATRNLLNDIDLIVYDMAGTTVQELQGKTKQGKHRFNLNDMEVSYKNPVMETPT